MNSLASALSPLAAASDADLRAFLSSDQLQSLLPLLDEFFTQATVLQTSKSTSTDENPSREVFSLFFRVTDAPKLLPLGVSTELLHVTRLVPFCQLYAPKNTQSVQELLGAVAASVPSFNATLTTLRQLLINQYGELHAQVVATKRGQVVQLLHRCYELSLAVSGLASSLTVTESLLLGGKDLEQELMLQNDSLLYLLTQSYEADLPVLQRQLAKFDEKVELQEQQVVAETRHALLVALGRCVDAVMEKQQTSETSGEELLAGLHALSNGCQDDDAEHGSFLSDLWFLCEYKDKVSDFFDHCKMDREHFSYLDMVAEELPRRRILPTMLVDDLATESKPKVALSAGAKEWKAPESNATTAGVEAKAPTPQTDEATNVVESMTHQVKDLFPDLGEGYVELCLLGSGLEVEAVIIFLLEHNPPPALIDVPQDLKQTDPEFVRLKAQITGKPTPTESKKLDPSRVWVGKKTQEKEYDPQIAKRDQQLAEKMKQIAVMYEEEEEYGVEPTSGSYGGVRTGDGDDDDVAALDEYDDDYNDEFEDYVPFSVHDGGNADDQDAIREHNRRKRVQEEKDAFWESMRNRNRDNPVNGVDDNDGEEEEEKEEPKTREQQRTNSMSRGSTPNDGQNYKTTRQKDKRQGNEGKPDEPMTPQQQQRMRARKDKNKAKVANHNRKDRALKKMG